MKQIRVVLLTLLVSVLFSLGSPTVFADLTRASYDYTYYYTFTQISGGYQVGLTSGFKAALNKASQSPYGDWTPGAALPRFPSTYNGQTVISLNGMFKDMTALPSINLSAWDTSTIIDMSSMFENCQAVTYINTSGWSTSKVKYMAWSFNQCYALQTIESLWAWNVSSVESFTMAFNECHQLDITSVSRWNPSSCTDFRAMFRQNYVITSINLSNWKVKSNASFWDFLGECKNLNFVNLNTWNASSLGSITLTYWFNQTGYASKKLAIYVKDAAMQSLISGKDANGNTAMLPSYAKFYYASATPKMDSSWYSSSYARSSITTISILSSIPTTTTYDETWEAGISGFGSLMVARKGSAVYISTQGKSTVQLAANASRVFQGFTRLSAINGLSMIDTSGALDMSFFFAACSNLTSINVPSWNTSKVKTMSNMFSGCSKLKTLNISSWNTSSVTNMSYMFTDCSSLTSLDISKWNTAKVTNMTFMFDGCTGLTSLNLSSWDVALLSDATSMFRSCSGLTSLNLGSWRTSSLKDMTGMFYACSSLTSLDLSAWDTSKVTKLEATFQGCTNLTTLNIASWNVSNVTSMVSLFDNCSSLTTLNISAWRPSKVRLLTSMFSGCSSLESVDLSKWAVSTVNNTASMFEGCSRLTSLNLSTWNMSSVTVYRYMFNGCYRLQTVTVGTGIPQLILSQLPTPSSTYIKGADGKWYNQSTKVGYTPSTLPGGVAATYTAAPPFDLPTAPLVTAALNTSSISQKSWVKSGVKLTASGSAVTDGVARYEYQIKYDNGTFSSWRSMRKSGSSTSNGVTSIKSAYAYPGVKGIYYVRAVSNAGLVSSVTTFELWVDSAKPTKPTYDLVSVGLGSRTLTFKIDDAPAVLTGTGKSGMDAVRCVTNPSVDQNDDSSTLGSWVTGGTISVNASEPGDYVFEARDKAGNVASFTYNIKASEPPVLEASVNMSTSTINLAVTSVGSSGLKVIQYYDPTVPAWTDVTTSTTGTYKFTKNGTYQFRAIDNLGTVSTTVYATVSGLDNANPVITSELILDTINKWGPVKIRLNATDLNTDGSQGSGIARIEYYSGSAWTTLTTSPSFDHAISSNGTYRYRAVDNKGKISAETSVLVTSIDTAKPVVTVTGTQKDPSGTFVTISLRASDPATGNSAVSSISEIQVYTSSQWMTVSNTSTGSFRATSNGTYKFRAIDKAGLISNEVSATIDAFDTTPPTLISSVAYKGSYAIITLTAADNSGDIAGIEIYDSSSRSWLAISSSMTSEYIAVSNGTYKFRALDRSGNISAEKSVTIQGLTASTGSLQVLIIGGREWTVSKSVVVTANDNNVPAGHTGISGIKEYAVSTSSKEPSTGWQTSGTFKITQNGTYYFWARDKAGWASSQKVTINTIDSTNPTAPTVVVNRVDNNKQIAQKEWTNVDARMTVSGAKALSGINRYEYRIGTLGTVTAMAPTSRETQSVLDPAGLTFSYTHIKQAKNTFALDEMIYVRAVSNSGLTSAWVPFDLWYDSLPPDTTSSFTVNTTDWTNKPVRITFTAKDSPAVVNGSAMSNIAKVRFKSSDSGLGVNGISTAWVSGKTITISVKDSTVFRFEAMDNAGNIKEFSYRVTKYDDVKAKTWIQDPTQEAAEAMNPDYFLDRIWTNQNITLTLHSHDIVPPNPPSGVAYLTTPDGKTAVPNIGKNSTKKFTKTQVIDHNGTFRFASEDAAGNINEINYTVWNIDKIAPSVEWTEDVRYYEGKSTIYINASDNLSGVDYIILPDGVTRVYADLPLVDHGYQPGDETPKLFTSYEVTQNGSYTFTVVDRAGNSVTKTFEYQDLRHDYAVKDGTFVLDGTPSTYTDLTVRATLQNYEGPGKDVSVKVYYMEGGQRFLLDTDTVDIPRASKPGTPGELNWKGTINLEDKTDITVLYIMVGEEVLHLDLNPSNNVRTLQIAKALFNFAITSTFSQKFTYPGQVIQIPYTVTGTGLGDVRSVPITITVGNSNMSRTFIYIGKNNNPVNGVMAATIPALTAGTSEELTLRARVNWDDRFSESNSNDNEFTTKLISQPADLALKVSGNDLSGAATLTSQAPQGSFMYPARYDKYDVTFSTRNQYENIVSVTTAGKTINQKKNNFTYTLGLDRGESQQFTIVVESAEGSESQSYSVTIKRGNDNIDVEVVAKIPNGPEFVGVPDTNGNYTINLPVNETQYELTIQMKDPNADVVTVNSTTVNDYVYKGDHSITKDSSNTHGVLVASEDKSLQKNFSVEVTTKNSNPSIQIVNKSELNNNVYGLGGVLKGTTFVPYGNDITSLEIAHRSGRTNGIVVQVKVTDLNTDQFLRGYMQLPGSDVLYEVHWNTFDGPTVMQVADIDYGYVYIDRTAIRSDISKQDVILYVSDYASDSEADKALSTATDKIVVGADITAPVIAGTPNENAGTIKDPKGTVKLNVSDSYTGVKDVTYRVTTDNGHTWTQVKSTTATGLIDLTGIYGDIVVEVTATDKILNKSSLNISLRVTSPDTEVNAEIYATTNRVADVTFINTRKQNADSIRKDILDTFG